MGARMTRIVVGVAAVLGLMAGASTVRAQDKDTLIIALDTLGAQVMDPIADTRAPHAHYHAPIWDSLVGFDFEKGGIGPGVAERWTRADDGKSWTFYLRKGLKFHNGDPVTGHDVKFSLERIMTPESISSGAAALRRAVDKIDVLDDYTVRVTTKGVIPHFAASLSRAVFMEGSVMPKKYIEAVGTKGFREKPIGSGPWKFVRNVPGDRIEFEAVTTPHWRGTPQFKKMTLLLVPEQSTRIAMVRTGEAGIASIGPEAIKEAQAGGMKVVSVPGTMQAVFQFWGLYRPEVKGSPLTDVRVREALSLAVDRQQIIDHVMAKQASWPLPFTTYRYSIDLDIPRWEAWAKKALRYDPARAKAAPGRSRPPQRLQDDVLEHRAARHAVHGPDRRGPGRLLGEDRREGRDEDRRVGRLRSDGPWRAEGPRRHRVDVSDGRSAGAVPAVPDHADLDRRAAPARRSSGLPRHVSGNGQDLRGRGEREGRCQARRRHEQDDGARRELVDGRPDHRGHGLLGGEPEASRPVQADPRSSRVR
jgi:hypothetical protein